MIDILHIDCMDYMRGLPDNAFDLAVVDPPYGVGSVAYAPGVRTNAPGGFVDTYAVTVATLDEKRQRPRFSGYTPKLLHTGRAKTTIDNFGDFGVSPPPEYFSQLFRVSRNQIIFGGNNFLLPPSRCFIVWDKCQGENFSMSMAEFVWTSFQSVSKIFRGQSNGTKSDPRIHPTQKPVT
jgi:site-specific DNA-methyltransferase (adenine-specific)